MIDICTYRVRIGCYKCRFASKYYQRSVPGNGNWGARYYQDMRYVSHGDDNAISGSKSSPTVFFMLSYYAIAILCSTFLLITSLHCGRHDSHSQHHSFHRVHPSESYLRGDISFSLASYINIAYLYLFIFLFKIMIGLQYTSLCKRLNVSKLSVTNIFFGSNISRYRYVISCLLLALLLLLVNFLIIAIVNPSIMNPGPDHSSLSVSYQNVQGLIPFGNLRDSHPTLDRTKLLELNGIYSWQ